MSVRSPVVALTARLSLVACADCSFSRPEATMLPKSGLAVAAAPAVPAAGCSVGTPCSGRALNLRTLLAGSPVMASHRGPECTRVQDAYSLRCAPQVAGGVRDTVEHAALVAGRELA